MLGFDAAATDYEDWQKAGFMEKDNYKVVIRIVYDKKDQTHPRCTALFRL